MLLKGLRVLGHAIRDEPHMFAISVVGSVLFSLLTIATAFVSGAVVGRVAVPAIDARHVVAGSLALGASAVLAVSLGKIVGIVARRLGAGAMQFNLQARYRRAVTRRYLRLPLAWHQRHATGTLLSNANADVESAWYPIAPFPFAVGTVVMLVAAVVSLFVTDWAMALVGVAIFPALLGVNVAYSRRMAPRVATAQQLRADVSAVAHESFDGALVVKTMGREAAETERFAAKAAELRDATIRVGRVRAMFDPVLDALPSVGTLIVLVVGAWRFRSGAVGVSEVVSVTFLFTVLAFPVRAIGWVLAELPRSVVGWERIRHVLDAEGDTVYGATELTDAQKPAALRFDDVHFAYRDSDGDRAADVLSGVTFDVPAGRTVALVGPTGSGKSTIAALAARLVDADTGSVSLDGVDVRELTQDSLVRTAALVAQVPFVFDDTVRGNITLDRPGAGDDAAWAALRLAQADGFVEKLADGLGTTVGERGASLSGGQRQRLTIARALAGAPRLLILDDATSAVDPRVEAAILAALRRDDAQQASILVVAYRRATIALADEVVYVERGRVVARGTHQELLATVPGYADLVTAYEKAEAEREREHPFDEGVLDDGVLDEGSVTA
ncbi:ABC transporter ATP-binding protein [Dactylosporangium sp. AC04546]|uniref:ABC transporter ATP-binding protein n=1 Tax=Dactylosporangium sp. AC04546 TaxID=2862460 RepID=UPI001EDDCBC7|nr:ABC transporter ATP-binding protein [Dactylosporangium sp. AC04546]WVK89787.1 ABC transporter ATP-binding protein [Dactylosporangium sp. AC04546]